MEPHNSGEKQDALSSPPEATEEIDPVLFFQATGDAVEIQRAQQAFRISGGHPTFFLAWLGAWTRIHPDKPLPAELTSELPRVQEALLKTVRQQKHHRMLERRVARELRFECLDGMGWAVGRRVARDLARIEVETDLGYEASETGFPQDMDLAKDASRPWRKAYDAIRKHGDKWRKDHYGNGKPFRIGSAHPAFLQVLEEVWVRMHPGQSPARKHRKRR